jgi:hypothetical protein
MHGKKGESENRIAEPIDLIFYVLDTRRLAYPRMDMYDVFLRRLEQETEILVQ